MGTEEIEDQELFNDETEHCVMCGAKTNYSKSEPISHRYGYVENVGQFCFRCAYFGGECGKKKGKDLLV